MPDNETLRCVPGSVDIFCETSGRTKVRVRTSDRKTGVRISAVGFDTSRVIVSPTTASTDADGSADFEVACQGGAFCPSTTRVTFDADDGGYDDCNLDVRCEKLPAPDSTALALTDIPPPFGSAGELHGFFVKKVLDARRDACGDDGRLIRQFLGELQIARVVSTSEARHLALLTEIASNPEKPARLAQACDLHNRLLADNAGTAALAISSIAVNSACTAIFADVDVVGDIVGGIVGGLVGSLFGPKGTIIGAVGGAVLLSSAEEAR